MPLTAAEVAVDEIGKLKGTITPTLGGIVASGSKVGSKYKFLKASTNAAYCPSLREDSTCALPEEIKSGYEIVINGVSREAIEESMRAGIRAACIVQAFEDPGCELRRRARAAPIPGAYGQISQDMKLPGAKTTALAFTWALTMVVLDFRKSFCKSLKRIYFILGGGRGKYGLA